LIVSTDRTELLPGADFVITSISVGGGAYYGHPYRAEIEIPRKYGIDQSVADTCSIGAVFRFLRTGPVQHQIVRDVERICPDALMLNHTNPMSMLTWLHSVDSNVRNVGLCHGVQYTAQVLARLLGIPKQEVSYKVAGINHLAWFLELRHGQEDMYPRLRRIIAQPDACADRKLVSKETVRMEIMRQFGYFPTESSKHDSEYMPYFRRTRELMDDYQLVSRIVGDAPPMNREWLPEAGDRSVAPPFGSLDPSPEYTSGIIQAVLTDVPYRFNGNVMNHGLIGNLPQNCCVEVPCLVDANGVQPCHVGDLPAQLAALDRANISVHELAVQAVLNKDREAAFHACALDPLTAAVLPLRRIRELFEELWAAEQDLLSWFNPSQIGRLPETSAN
jgi:alpha-galactosidase